MENCPGLIASNRPRFKLASAAGAQPASLRLALNADQVRITYIGHSTFLIESPRLVRIATDYNDYVRPPVLPTIVTMNRAHSTHYTDNPDPGIKHVLRGWGPSPEQPARHDLQVSDVRVRNVPTNIRSWITGGTERHGNSIFIFEIANMCIAHLGHLHHTLTQQQLNEIGRIDVVMVPVDGGATLDLEGMIEVLEALKAPLMIPMHFFSTYTLQRFLAAPGHDLVGTDQRQVCLIEIARLLGRQIEYGERQAEGCGGGGERRSIGRLLAQAQEREFEAKRIIERATVGEPEVRCAPPGQAVGT
jgi:L-ascorbate metabolism protein UlaG (beta-lactamase superfamily)